MKNYIISLFALTGALSAVNAQTQESSAKNSGNTGFYGNVAAGFASFSDVEVEVIGAAYDDDAEVDSGYSASLVLGYDFGKYRVEGEFSHMSGDIDSLGNVDVDSEFTSNNFMLNGLVDFEFDKITLSVGGGLGFSDQSYDEMATGGIKPVDDVDDTVFAYQGILRGSYAINENALLGLSYRYVAASDFSDSGQINTGGPTITSDIEIDGSSTSLFEIFFSYRF